MSTPMGATFVMVRPAKAVELKDGFAQRVVPESSLHAVTSEVLDKFTGMRSEQTFSTQLFPHAAVGIAQPQEGAAPEVFRTHSEADICVVVVGRLTNAQELRETYLPDESGEMNDAALIGKLYSKMQKDKAKYAFVSELKGEFSTALYCAKSDNVLAARSTCGKYMLSQGVDKKTGGLLVTNALLTNGHELTEIPGGNFVFGKFRERILHPMHREGTIDASPGWRSVESSHRKSCEMVHGKQTTPSSRRSMDGSHTRRSASLDLPVTEQREAAFAAAQRALAGLKISTPSRDPFEPEASETSTHSASEIPAAPQGRTTPSAKGTADKQTTWRRVSLDGIKEEVDHKSTAIPHHAAHHSKHTSLSHRATTTPSAKGTADHVDSWRRSPAAANHAPAGLNSWTPVAIGSILADIAEADQDAHHHPAARAPAQPAQPAAGSQSPLDYSVQGIHTELLTQALDEFMEGGSLPRPSSIERCAGMDVSRSSYEDLLTLSRLSGSARGGGVQVKSQSKVNRRPSYKVKKEGAVGENTMAGSPITSAGKRFVTRF